ncbi:M3 family metallopeptidase [Microlunatus sp. Y2014]|uniref:M3 family metallopeptidase n=1 Tax=Microlunatus sp. Y2014 TaxID=3418488 RepID=UPI003DA702B1
MTLNPLALPDTDDADAWTRFVDERADTALTRARAIVADLKDGSTRTADEVLNLWNDCDIEAANSSTFVSLLSEAHPDPAVRELAEAKLQATTTFLTQRGQDRDLHKVLSEVDAGALDATATRLLEHVLRDFRRSGVDADDATRARLTEINDRLVVVSQEFSRNVRDDVRSIMITPDQLAGLPEDYIADHPADADGRVRITTDYPDMIPYLTFARDRSARLALSHESTNRAWPANDPLLHELVELRAELASLLGYDSWPDFDAEVKMIKTGDAIGEFIDRVSELAEASARKDFAVLLERARADDPSITELFGADHSYYAELVRREQFDVDAQRVRRYFDFTRVRAGLLEVTGRLFGISYDEVTDAPAWHPDVTTYDVVRDGRRIGRIHLDLHPRDGKYKHAAQFDLVTGVTGRQLPEGTLVCNFPRELMEHTQVVTLFHEFGHLVHHVLGGDQQWSRFSGVATEWDFVEAPSQMLEEWAWDADILRSFAHDADGEPIPTDLVDRMRTANEFGRGYNARTQLFYAALSYRLHLERPADHTAMVRELQARHSLLAYLPDSHFQAAFGHLDGYSSGYYTYMWSLVIAKDLFSAFDADDLFAAEVAGRYRDAVLAPGGSADAADLVAEFLGRDYSFDAFGRWLGGSDAGPDGDHRSS